MDGLYQQVLGRAADSMGLDFTSALIGLYNYVPYVTTVGGLPTPPPPNTIGEGPWVWTADLNNSRGDNFIDPDGRRASWDAEGSGHWDVDDGFGDRNRYDRWGTPLTSDEAHGPIKGPPRTPLFFKNLLKVLPPIFITPEQIQEILSSPYQRT